MHSHALVLDEQMRRVVAEAVGDQCSHRNWELIALGVRTNHVHVVIAYAGVPPERMIRELKSRATRWLRERRRVSPMQRVWAAGGSRKYLWRPEQVRDAVAYVQEGQDVPR